MLKYDIKLDKRIMKFLVITKSTKEAKFELTFFQDIDIRQNFLNLFYIL